MKFLWALFLKILFIFGLLFQISHSDGKAFYEKLLEEHREFRDDLLENNRYFKNRNFYKQILKGVSLLSLSALESRYPGYGGAIKLLRNLNHQDKTVRDRSQKRIDEILFKINSSSDQSSIELVRLFVGVFLYSIDVFGHFKNAAIYDSAADFLSRIQNRRIVFFEIEQELISILFSPELPGELRIVAAKALGKLKPKNPYVPNQLVEAFYFMEGERIKREHSFYESLVFKEVAKALLTIQPGKLVDALYHTDKLKSDTVGPNVVIFPIPANPEEEKSYRMRQELKGLLFKKVLDQPESVSKQELSAREDLIRVLARQALGVMRPDHPDIYFPLIDNFLFNEDPSVRKEAVSILWDLNLQRLAFALYTAISDTKKTVRMAGIRAVKEVKLGSLWHDEYNHRDWLFSFLSKHGLERLLDKELNGNYWKNFMDALSHSNMYLRIAVFVVFMEEVISRQLINNLSHSDADVRNSSLRVLKMVNPERMTATLNRLSIRRGISRTVIFECYNAFFSGRTANVKPTQH